jgi:hypothetical protein
MSSYLKYEAILKFQYKTKIQNQTNPNLQEIANYIIECHPFSVNKLITVRMQSIIKTEDSIYAGHGETLFAHRSQLNNTETFISLMENVKAEILKDPEMPHDSCAIFTKKCSSNKLSTISDDAIKSKNVVLRKILEMIKEFEYPEHKYFVTCCVSFFDLMVSFDIDTLINYCNNNRADGIARMKKVIHKIRNSNKIDNDYSSINEETNVQSDEELSQSEDSLNTTISYRDQNSDIDNKRHRDEDDNDVSHKRHRISTQNEELSQSKDDLNTMNYYDQFDNNALDTRNYIGDVMLHDNAI